MAVNYDVPYFSQVNNRIEPWRTCGSTSAAMCLKYFKVPDIGSLPQYEDDIKARFDRLGIAHDTPSGIKQLLEGLGLRDDLTMRGSVSDITQALDSGKICILHGFWTIPGHIVVIRGYSDDGYFYVNDPQGEWFYEGYCVNAQYFEDNKGENQRYSRRLISTAGNAWSLRQTLHYYDTWSSNEIENTATMWLHRISR